MRKVILAHFAKSDPTLYVVAKTIKLDIIKPADPENYFASLVEIIVNQQLSSKAADAIYKKIINLFSKQKVDAKEMIKLSDENIRKAGLSYTKIKYIKELAQKILKNEVKLDNLQKMEEEEVINDLVKIKGIGRWSAEMFLMFSLVREDVFSYGDLGLRRAMQKLYKLKKEPTFKKALEISKKWSPYRTYACRILWRI